MSNRKFRVRTIVLGLTVSPLSTNVFATEHTSAGADRFVRSLVASSSPFEARATYVESSRPEHGIDGSGVGPDVAVSQLFWVGDSGLPMTMPTYAFAGVANLGTLDASGVLLQLSVSGAAYITNVPGCSADGSGSWYCDI